MTRKREDRTVVLTKGPNGGWIGNQEMGTPGSGGPMGSLPIDIRPGDTFYGFTYSQLERVAQLCTPPATELVVNLTKKQILAVTA